MTKPEPEAPTHNHTEAFGDSSTGGAILIILRDNPRSTGVTEYIELMGDKNRTPLESSH